MRSGVRSWKVRRGARWVFEADPGGPGRGERVKEQEWDGWLFLKRAMARERREVEGSEGVRAVEWGVRRKVVWGLGWCGRGGGEEGGYACVVMELMSVSTEVREEEEEEDGPGVMAGARAGIGSAVRQVRERAASVWYGEECGTGTKLMKTPGGKEGARILRYQPRLGWWMDQQMVDVGVSWDR